MRNQFVVFLAHRLRPLDLGSEQDDLLISNICQLNRALPCPSFESFMISQFHHVVNPKKPNSLADYDLKLTMDFLLNLKSDGMDLIEELPRFFEFDTFDNFGSGNQTEPMDTVTQTTDLVSFFPKKNSKTY